MSEHDKLPLDRDALDHIAECIRSHGVNVPPVGDATMFALVDQSHAAISLAAALSAARAEGAAEGWAHANGDEHSRESCPICAREAMLGDVPGKVVTDIPHGDRDFKGPALAEREVRP